MTLPVLTRPRLGGLWGHPDFMKLWVGQTISEVGSTVTREALPLTAALALGATPLQMGALAAAGAAPVLLVGLMAGVWVDRLRRRPLMVAADLGRAALLVSIPLAAALNVLTMTQLFVTLPLVGVLTMLFDTAYQAFVPSLLRHDQLMEANTKLGLSGAAAEVSAPGLAGVLVQAISGPGAVLLDALSFLCSAILVARIQSPEQAPARAQRLGLLREAADGLRAVRGAPLLRAFAGSATVSSFFGNFFAALYTLYAIRVLGMGPALLGLTVACGGVGDFAGAVVVGPLSRRFGVGPTLLGAAVLGSLVGLLTPLASGPPLAAAGLLMATQFLGDASAAVYGINELSLRQAITPRRLLGRVNASIGMLTSGVGPLGALAGGALAGAVGIRQTLAIAVVGASLRLPWLLYSPLRHLRTLPTGEETGPDECDSGDQEVMIAPPSTTSPS